MARFCGEKRGVGALLVGWKVVESRSVGGPGGLAQASKDGGAAEAGRQPARRAEGRRPKAEAEGKSSCMSRGCRISRGEMASMCRRR